MKKPTPGIARSQAELARALGADRKTVARWIDRGCPRRRDGGFDVDAVQAWVAIYRSASRRRGPPKLDSEALTAGDELVNGTGAASAASRELREATREYRALRAEREHITVARLRGKLIERSQVSVLLRERLVTLQSRVATVVDRMEERHPGIRQDLERELRWSIEVYERPPEIGTEPAPPNAAP